jgi:hypothetical protein
MDVIHCPFWANPVAAWPEKERPDRQTLSRAVTIQNNVIRSQSHSGLELDANDLKAMTGVWKIGHNSFIAEPKYVGATALPVFAKQPTDLVVAGPFLSEDSKQADYLRIPVDGRLATSGAGGNLPKYIGPFPPGAPPKDGDWFTRLQEVVKRLPGSTFTWPADALRGGRITAPSLASAKNIFRDDFANAKDVGPWSLGKGYTSGLERGCFHVQHDGPGITSWNRIPRTFVQFIGQAEGRVFDNSSDEWFLNLADDERKLSVKIMINGEGGVRVAWADHGKGERGTSIYEGKHSAIKPKTDFNRVMVILRSRLLEIYVNNVAVCNPIELDAEIGPVFMHLGLISKKKGRAELHNVSVWSAEGIPFPKERLEKGEVPLKEVSKPAVIWETDH